MVDKGKPEEVASLQGRLTGVRFTPWPRSPA